MDIEKPAELTEYLRRTGRIGERERPNIQCLRGGVSNRTVLVERPNGERWVLKQALSKLRVDIDWYSNPRRVHREAAGARWLSDKLPIGTVPSLVFEDREHMLFAMEAVPTPHVNWKRHLLNGGLQLEHVRQFARLLGTIHRRGYHHREEVADVFRDRTFLKSLRIDPYYAYTAERIPEAAAFLRDLVEDVLSTRVTLVHGDYSPKNILIYQDELILLDHEVIHFGDPGLDIGFSLTHLLSKAHHLQEQRDAFREAAHRYWKGYFETVAGLPWTSQVEPDACRHTLACLLARVEGRSRLEYMSRHERARQRQAVLSLIDEPPTAISDLISSFLDRL